MDTNAPPLDAGSFPTVLLSFVHRLRDAAVPVSMVEALDAVESIRHVDLSERSHLKTALSATLVKRADDQAAFDSLFDIYFPVRRELVEVETSLDRTSDGHGEVVDELSPAGPPSSELLEQLLHALRSGDESVLRALATAAVGMFGGLGDERDAGERYYLFRILRQLELSELLRQAVLQARGEGEGGALDDRLLREELGERVELFRKMLAEELRWQLAELRGAEETAQVFHDRPVEDVPFLAASPTELRQMREAIRPLAAKLAAKVARRRRFQRHGRLDVRRTIRRSLSAGGVPLDPAFRYRHASKPVLYLLCDISGSMAEFARFTMSLLYAMKGEFSRIRLFVFVDGIDEVTDRFREGSDWLTPRNLLYGSPVVAADGHSDYGGVFERFWRLYGHADLDPRSTVIVTGDARNNYRDDGVDALRSIANRARRVYWLNPEPRPSWNESDSIMERYEPLCTDVYEVRNLRQLAEFVVSIS